MAVCVHILILIFDIYFIVPEGKFVLDTVHSVALQDSTKDNSQQKGNTHNRYCTLSIWPEIHSLHIAYSIAHIKNYN